MNTFNIGDKAYFIVSNLMIEEVTILQKTGNMYLIKLPSGGGIRVRESRLYKNKEDALKIIPGNKDLGKEEVPSEKKKKRCNPYDYWH